MDILIKNTEMPKYCRGCPFEVSSIYGQRCCITRKFTRLNDNEDGMKRHISCPLNPLPEHGTLKDYDSIGEKMANKMEKRKGTWHPFYYEGFKAALKMLDSAPTIVEANNGTDN